MPKSQTLLELGQIIKGWRLAKGLTQEQLGFSSELDRTYISDLERGNRNPSYIGLRKLAKGLGIPLPEMLNQITEQDFENEKEK